MKLQLRIATATDVWLNVAAYDYFGLGLPGANCKNLTQSV